MSKVINLKDPKILHLSIEQFVLEHGFFCTLKWALSENLLSFDHYNDWRQLKINTLDDCIQLNEKQLICLLLEIKVYLLKRNFEPHEQIFFSSNKSSPIKIRTLNPVELELSFSIKWTRNKLNPQLDLFLDNTEEIVRNDLVKAITNREFNHAMELISKLIKITCKINVSNTDDIFEYQKLLDYGNAVEKKPFIDIENIANEIEFLENEITPLAIAKMNQMSKDYLTLAWKRISNNTLEFPFDKFKPNCHSSYIFLKLSDYNSTIESILNEPNYRDNLVLLYRLVTSFAANGQSDTSLVYFCSLWELDNNFALSNIEEHSKYEIFLKPIMGLLSDFRGEFDDEYLELFPAYLLTQRQELVNNTLISQKLTNPSSRCMISLIKTKFEEGDEISLRAKVQSFHPHLLEIYMQLIV